MDKRYLKRPQHSAKVAPADDGPQAPHFSVISGSRTYAACNGGGVVWGRL